MSMINWKPRLISLQKLEYDEEHRDTHHKAARDASSWERCSVAERMLSITKSWAKLGSYGRCLVLKHQGDLCNIGSDFMDAVKDVDYKRALRLHDKIQKFSLDEPGIKHYIQEHT